MDGGQRWLVVSSFSGISHGVTGEEDLSVPLAACNFTCHAIPCHAAFSCVGMWLPCLVFLPHRPRLGHAVCVWCCIWCCVALGVLFWGMISRGWAAVLDCLGASDLAEVILVRMLKSCPWQMSVSV
jgi:hypothetical protein